MLYDTPSRETHGRYTVAQIQLLGQEKSRESPRAIVEGLLTTSGGVAASVVFPVAFLGVLANAGFVAGRFLGGRLLSIHEPQ